MGTYDSTSFFIGYWYPQIAVYDDIDGWDHNNYGGQHEFYNDFFYSFNDGTGENLNWYWSSWFINFGYPDLSITKVVIDGTNLSVTVKKKETYPYQLN